ncbi:hypothetical protein EV122DRAFT_283109 [Schizophyllum commune]
MSLDALPPAARLEAEEKESLKVAIAALYIELRHAKAARTQAVIIAARARQRTTALDQREANMNAAFAAFTPEIRLLRQDMCRLRDELQAPQQETFKAHQDAQYSRAQSAESCAALDGHLRGLAKPFPGKGERVI